MENTATFHATLEYLPNMLGWVREKLHPLPMDATEKNRFEVAAEEILVNIICYAYENKPGKIEMVWEEQRPLVFLTFKDFGLPFNPLDHQAKPNHQELLEQRHIGGLGIFFVKNFVDHIEYQHVEGANVLTITKRIYA